MGWRGVWEEDAAISLLLFPFESVVRRRSSVSFHLFSKNHSPLPPLKKKQEQARGDPGQCRKGPRGRSRLPQGPGREAELRPRVDQYGVGFFLKPSFLFSGSSEKKRRALNPQIFFLSKHRIASANLGDYLASSRYYARALALNPRASSVWGYLRTSLACAGRADLLEAADAEDAAAIERALPL